MQKNTPKLWDDLWEERSEEEDLLSLKKEETSIRWLKIEKIVNEKFADIKKLKIIEVGAGSGANALLFAKRGAKVTILDYSEKAIERSKEMFKRNNCKAKFILADALNLNKKIIGKYDIAFSFGLAEHFINEQRIQIIKSHFDLINTNGLVLISVPNKLNPPYRINKFILGLIKKWKFGEEYPFTRKEFSKICDSLGFKKITFIGDSFISSFRFVNPFLLIRKLRGKKTTIEKIKKDKSSIFDDHFGYALVLVGEKNN